MPFHGPIEEFFDSIGDFFTVDIPDFFEDVGDFFTEDIPKFFTETLPGVFSPILNFFENIGKMVIALFDLMNEFFDFFIKIGPKIIPFFEKILDLILYAISILTQYNEIPVKILLLLPCYGTLYGLSKVINAF